VANPGMGSRVAHHVNFPDYNADELLAIARVMVAERDYVLDEAAEDALAAYVERRREQPRFANARSIRNAIDRARLRHAARLFDAPGAPTREDLVTLEACDILASSVFA
jgi:AAA lid domain